MRIALCIALSEEIHGLGGSVTWDFGPLERRRRIGKSFLGENIRLPCCPMNLEVRKVGICFGTSANFTMSTSGLCVPQAEIPEPRTTPSNRHRFT
jgi:hypothetical protein